MMVLKWLNQVQDGLGRTRNGKGIVDCLGMVERCLGFIRICSRDGKAAS